jgi:hypothetical protein
MEKPYKLSCQKYDIIQTKNTLNVLYYALVYPYLTYGNLIWGYTHPTRLLKILNSQKKINMQIDEF